MYEVLLSWNDPNIDEDGYEIEWKGPGDSVWTVLGSVGPDVTSLVHKDIHPGGGPRVGINTYRIRPFRSGVFGPYSAETTVDVQQPALVAPTLSGVQQ